MTCCPRLSREVRNSHVPAPYQPVIQRDADLPELVVRRSRSSQNLGSEAGEVLAPGFSPG